MPEVEPVHQALPPISTQRVEALTPPPLGVVPPQQPVGGGLAQQLGPAPGGGLPFIQPAQPAIVAQGGYVGVVQQPVPQQYSAMQSQQPQYLQPYHHKQQQPQQFAPPAQPQLLVSGAQPQPPVMVLVTQPNGMQVSSGVC